jgi:hypothetical protein
VASAGEGVLFITLPFGWVVTQRFEHGLVREYQLTRGDLVAILQRVAGRGWAMTVVHGPGQRYDRGLFATPHDALMVLAAEFAVAGLSLDACEAESA